MFEDTDEQPKPARGERGKWLKGTRSPNPRGYTREARQAHQDVKEAARRLTPLALRTLEAIMRHKAPPSALGEDFADIHAAGEHARRMARELASEPHGSGAAIVVSDGRQELFEVALADYR